MNHQVKKMQQREKRHLRIRKKMCGTTERPRLSVFRSLKHIYAQLIDDTTGRTLISVSTLTPEIKAALKTCGNKAAAEAVGAKIAQTALSKGLKAATFDRGAFKFHGRIKALAEAARKNGLSF